MAPQCSGQERQRKRTLAEGDGWILTDTKDPLTEQTRSLQLLVYNYSHYTDLNCYRYKRLDTPSDAYSVFLQGEKLQLRFLLSGLPEGRFRIERRLLNRDHGSSFDQWLLLQAPPCPSQEEIRYMKENAEPAVRMETVPCSGSLVLDVTLRPLEMELICLTC